VLILSLNRKVFTDQYLNYKNIEDLAKQYGCTGQTIQNWAKKFGISRKINISKKMLKKVLIKNLTSTETAAKLKCSTPTLYKYMKLYKIEHNFNPFKKINIDDLYKLRVIERRTYKYMANLYSVSDTFIRNRCNEFEFPPVDANKKNREAIEWKLKPLVNKRADKKLKELYEML